MQYNLLSPPYPSITQFAMGGTQLQSGSKRLAAVVVEKERKIEEDENDVS